MLYIKLSFQKARAIQNGADGSLPDTVSSEDPLSHIHTHAHRKCFIFFKMNSQTIKQSLPAVPCAEKNSCFVVVHSM